MIKRSLSLILTFSLLCTLLVGCTEDDRGDAAVTCTTAASRTATTTAVVTTSATTAQTTVHATVHTSAISVVTKQTTGQTSPVSTTSAISTAPMTTQTTTSAPDEEVTEAEWLVLEYLCGSDLESDYGAATANLEELVSASVGGGSYHCLIETGGTKTWHCGVDEGRIQRWYLQDGQLRLVHELALSSMGDPDTLTEFIVWAVEHYPARHLLLILWDHGGGSLSGAVFDELYAGDSLTLEELGLALEQSCIHLDILGFDACLMASLETAAALSPYADYMIASEDTVPASGWDYQALMDYLSLNPCAVPEELAMDICDSYLAKCGDAYSDSMATLSVIDLQAVPTLLSSFNAMAEGMLSLSCEIDGFAALSRGARKAECYGGTDGNSVDLADLTENLREALPGAADAVLNALDSAVLYRVQGENRQSSRGLSVFYPLNADADLCESYRSICPADAYLTYLSAVVSDWSPTDLSVIGWDPVASSDYPVETETVTTEDGFYELTLTSGREAVERVQAIYAYLDYENGLSFSLGSGTEISLEEGEALCRADLRGSWMTVNRLVCAPTLLEQTESYYLYDIPILLNSEERTLRVRYSIAAGSYSVVGIYGCADSTTGMASRFIRQPEPGDEISPLFDCVDLNSGEQLRCFVDTILCEDVLTVSEASLSDGTFCLTFLVSDVFGGNTLSEALEYTLTDGVPAPAVTEEIPAA